MRGILLVLIVSFVATPLLAERKITSHADVTYPKVALDAGASGTISVEVTIAADGSVKSAISRSLPKVLTLACEENAKTWKFEPGKEETVYGVFVFRIIEKGKPTYNFDPVNYMVTIEATRPSVNSSSQ